MFLELLKEKNKNLFNKNTKGFTLIELLIVIAIIGILSSVIFGSYQTVREKSIRAYSKNTIHSIMNEMALYYSTKGSYLNFMVTPEYKKFENNPEIIKKFYMDRVFDNVGYDDLAFIFVYTGLDGADPNLTTEEINEFWNNYKPNIFYTFSGQRGVSDYKNAHFSDSPMTYDQAVAFCSSYGEKIPYGGEILYIIGGFLKLPDGFVYNRRYWGYEHKATVNIMRVSFAEHLGPEDGAYSSNIPYTSRNNYSYYVACAK